MALADDPKLLADLITALGGRVIPGESFRFDLPLSQVKETVPKLTRLGLGVRKVDEHQDDGPPNSINRIQSIATLELYRPESKRLNRIPEGF